MRQKIIFILSILPLILLFQNCDSMSAHQIQGAQPNSSISGDNFVTAKSSASNSHTNKAFGPSPLAGDGRSIFNYNASTQRLEKEAMWLNLKTRFSAIYLHTFLLINDGDVYSGTASTSVLQSVALNNNQLEGLQRLQSVLGFKIIVDTGLGLGTNCIAERNPERFARAAVDRDYTFLKRLHDNGVSIDEVTVDGPFLRVVEGSNKAFSCATTGGLGFNTEKSAEIVSRYLGKLQREIRTGQTYNPKMNILLNYPNYKAGTHSGFFDVQLEDFLDAFTPRQEYPAISELVLDYPYSYVKNNQALFQNKISFLSNTLSSFRGTDPKISVIINTGASFAPPAHHTDMERSDYTNVGNILGYTHGKQCLHQGNQAPFMTLITNNTCFSSSTPQWKKNIANAYIEEERKRYIRDSTDYYRLVRNNLPTGVEIESTYFASWYEFPANMSAYAANATSIVNAIGQ